MSNSFRVSPSFAPAHNDPAVFRHAAALDEIDVALTFGDREGSGVARDPAAREPWGRRRAGVESGSGRRGRPPDPCGVEPRGGLAWAGAAMA
jgi:hypothetical protein